MLKQCQNRPIKKLIRQKIQEKAYEYLITKRNNRNGKGMALSYQGLEIQNYLFSDNIEITNTERKYIFQFRTQMSFGIKCHFRNMHANTICDGCQIEQSTTSHTLICNALMGGNEIVTYIPNIEDLYGENEDEQVYISRLLQDNIRRMQHVAGQNIV